MYFPYLFDKQSELLALRGLAGSLGSPQKIVPLIEPVSSIAGLSRLHAKFKESGDYAYVVENPGLLKLAIGAHLAAWKRDARPLFADQDVFRPVYKESNATTTAEIRNFVARYPSRPIGIVLNSGRIPVPTIFSALVASDSLIFMTAGADRVALVAAFGAARTVEINDRFPTQRVNADYRGVEWFSRDHLDYATTGYPGFSDYTMLPSKPNKQGGGAPGAVAIHLTYKYTDRSFWVEHFVSDETDRNVGSAGSKMLEAIAYIAAEVAANATKFDSSPALAEYLAIHASGANSSLGNNKKLEIAHHIYTVALRL